MIEFSESQKEELRKRGMLRDAAEPAGQGLAQPDPRKHARQPSPRAESPGGGGSNDKFLNPYHFVPVKRRTESAHDLGTQALANAHKGGKREAAATPLKHYSHHRYAGGPDLPNPIYDGRILCCLTTKDPIFIGKHVRSEATDSHPAEWDPFELEPGQPAIPASSLRGMIASVAEAASNSALRVLHDRPLSVRKGLPGLQALGMLVETKDAKGKTELKLRPLALPAIECDRDEKGAPIPGKYRVPAPCKKMFPQPLLKVYVDGYQPSGRPPVPVLDPSSFLARQRPKSYSPDNAEYWYARLDPVSIAGEEIRGKQLRPKEIRRRDGTTTHFLVGQYAVGDPISKDEYDSLSEPERKQYTRGILRVLGIEDRQDDIPKDKHHEIFLPYSVTQEKDEGSLFDVQDALRQFQALADERTENDGRLPFGVKGSRRNANPGPKHLNLELRAGDIVFFRPDASGTKVAEVSVSSIWRCSAGGGVHDYFKDIDPELLPFNEGRERLSPAELLFGLVEQKKEEERDADRSSLALASRVRFSFGRLPQPDANAYLEEVPLKILDSPKPPSPALYFRWKDTRRDDQHIAKPALNRRDHTPKGRKFYLHRWNNDPDPKPWETKIQPGDRDYRPKQRTKIRPIAPEKVFYFHLDFSNLSQYELGMLCYALNPPGDFHHKLGRGKPIGLGKVKVESLGVFLVHRADRYGEADVFDSPRYSRIWLSDDATAKVDDWPDWYGGEKEAARAARGDNRYMEPTLFDRCHNTFAATVDPDIAVALQLLGDPAKVARPVHTPQVAGRHIERETYGWFVVNERSAWEQLKPLNRDSEELPPLTRHAEDG